MRCFFIAVTVTYDGYEWRVFDLLEAKDEADAKARAERKDYTHPGSGEQQMIEEVRPVLLGHELVLRKYLW